MTRIVRKPRAAGYTPAVRMSGRRPLLACAAALLLAGSASAADFVVGVAGPMSGPLASAGKQFLAAVTLAAATINDAGGLNGDRIRIIRTDDLATPAGAKKAARELASRNVRTVIGHYNSAAAIAAGDTYAAHNVLLIAPTAVVAKLTDRDGANVIRLAPRHEAQAVAAARFMRKKCTGGQIAFAHDGNAFSKTLQASAKSALASSGLKVSIAAEIASGSRQAPAAIANLSRDIAAAGAACLYWSGPAREAASLLRALRRKKSSVLFIGGENLAARDFPAMIPAGVNAGVIAGVIAGVWMTVPRDHMEGPQAAAVLTQLSRQLPGLQPEEAGPAIAAYAATQLLAAGARAAGSNDPRRIGAVLRSGKRFPTVTGPASFDAKGDRRENLYAMARWSIAEDGKPIFLPESDMTKH